MTELEAVNTMLRAIGQVPVINIPPSGQSDSRVALDILNENAKEFQAEGFDFNQNTGEELTPTVDSLIVLPEGTVRVTSYYPYQRFVERGGLLYDLDRATTEFTQPVKVNRVFVLPFEELPYALQRYVNIRSARVFASRAVGAQELNSYLGEEEVRARLQWLQSQAVDMDLNVLSTPSHHRPNVFQPYRSIIR